MGDDDVIIIPDRINGATADRHDFWAGDGDDTITIGSFFETGYGWGGRGDDTFNLPENYNYGKYYGGLGDDIFIPIAEDLAPDNTGSGSLALYGGEGNDKI